MFSLGASRGADLADDRARCSIHDHAMSTPHPPSLTDDNRGIGA
jgi:hypothetical protein